MSSSLLLQQCPVCLPEVNKNNDEDILYFTNTLLDIVEEHIPKSSTLTKYNRLWFNEEC